MRRAILHIGMPRTATSALQYFLQRRRDALAVAGIDYPDLAEPSAAVRGNHKILGEALDGRRTRRERAVVLDALDAALAAAAGDVLILSYEGLCQIGAWRRPWRPLAVAFARHGFAMEVLLTIKPQSEYLNSTYAWRAQFLREGRPFADFARATLARRTLAARRLDYAALARPWARAAGGRLHVVPVRHARSDMPFLARVLDVLGLGDRAGALVTRHDVEMVVNRSPGPVAVEVSRRLHLTGAHRRLADPGEAMRFVIAAARERGLDGTSFRGVTPDWQAAIEAHFAAANDRFAQAAWGEPWEAVVAPTRQEPVNEIGGTAADPAVAAAIVEIAAAAEARFGAAKPRRRWPWR